MDRLQMSVAVPVVTTGSAYASGQNIGGLLTFPNAVTAGFAAIYSVLITDAAGNNAGMDLLLFSEPITAPTDKVAVAISSANLTKCVGMVSFVTADYVSVGTGTVAGKTGKTGLFMGVVGTSDNNLYGVLVSRGTPTYVSASDLTVKVFAEIGRA